MDIVPSSSTIWGSVLTVAIDIVVCIVMLIVTKAIFKKLIKKNDGIHIKFFNSLLSVIIFAIGAYKVLSDFAITRDMGKTLIQSSALLLAVVTFAAQQALGNVISGFAISASKPYDIGAKIKVMSGGSLLAEGIVKDITIRHTVINTFDGQSCIIPNSVMDAAVIINTNYTENVGNFLEIEVSYDTDVDKAINIIKEIILANPLTLNDENMRVSVSNLVLNGIIIKTTVWTKTLDDNFLACSDIRREILKQFRENDIVIPYTTVTISNLESK